MIQSGGGSQLKKKSNHILMDKTKLENLKNLSKSDLINFLNY